MGLNPTPMNNAALLTENKKTPRGCQIRSHHQSPKITLHMTNAVSVTSIGKVKWKVAPRPPLVVAHNRPPCDSTIERLMANPIPLPCGLVVKKAEKIWSKFPAGSPGPGSLTQE